MSTQLHVGINIKALKCIASFSIFLIFNFSFLIYFAIEVINISLFRLEQSLKSRQYFANIGKILSSQSLKHIIRLRNEDI